MATYDVTGAGETAGHSANGRTPYMIENTIDVSAINGDAGAAQNDVIRCLDVPAESVVLHACLLYTSPSPRDLSTSRMPSSA